MKILVDTSIWSLALRRSEGGRNPEVIELQELISDGRVQLIGPLRQEILSGIKTKNQFETLQQYLEAFPDLPLVSGDYELAAEYYNTARQRGIQGSNTDFLLCAISTRHSMPIFTADKDFDHFIEHIPIAFIPRKLESRVGTDSD
jgi:predicted nucleic acid-binding protein